MWDAEELLYVKDAVVYLCVCAQEVRIFMHLCQLMLVFSQSIIF